MLKKVLFLYRYLFFEFNVKVFFFRYVVGKEVFDKLNVFKIVSVGEDYNIDSLDSKVCIICFIFWCFVIEKYREN